MEIRGPNQQKPTGNWDSLLTIKILLVIEIRAPNHQKPTGNGDSRS